MAAGLGMRSEGGFPPGAGVRGRQPPRAHHTNL